MRYFIKGIGWVTAAGFGQGRNATEHPLCPGPLQIPKRKQVFEKTDQRFGRFDDFSRVGLTALAFCLRDAGEEARLEMRSIGIVVASRYGCLPTDLAYLQSMLQEHGKYASPNLFAYTLPNCFLGEAALRFGLTGNTLVLNQRNENGLAQLQYALEELQWSEQQGILAGVCDLPPPVDFAEGTDCPGSLFFLIGKEPLVTLSGYGEIKLHRGTILFAGKEVFDLSSLVTACLTAQE